MQEDERIAPVPVKSTLLEGDEEADVLRQDSSMDGQGQWKAWVGGFREPELAFLDLFDNCIDATLVEGFDGKIDIFRDRGLDGEEGGICVRNNCAHEIPSLQKVLQAYGSSKDSDQIGQNGVGIKHACAALSDLSLVITKNLQSFSIGVISKGLQQVDGVCLFSYKFEYATLNRDLDRMLLRDEDFCDSVALYGDISATRGKEKLVRHIDALLEESDEHIFLVILDRIRNVDTDGGVSGLLKNVATQLPKSYLHVPPSFHITVDSERIQFQYWERRLVELHYFPLLVDPKNPYKESDDWAEPRNCHMIFLYMGFDPLRAITTSGGSNKASLFVYSRKSGRLVKEMEDARGYLKLSNGGSDYAQGLTVIIDDFGGNLPLTPTKQDILFGPSGKSHEQNLSAWAGAFTHCYWEQFARRFGDSKTVLWREVVRHIPTVKDILSVKFCTVPATLSQTKMFSTFEYMQFHIQKNTNYIRCNNKKGNNVYKWVQREGTQIKFRIKSGGAAAAKKTKAVAQKPRKKRAKPSDDSLSVDISDDISPTRATPSVVDYTPTDSGSLWEDNEDETVAMEDSAEDPELKGTSKDPDQQPSDERRETKATAKTKAHKKNCVGTEPSVKNQSEKSENDGLEKLVKELRKSLTLKEKQVQAAVKTVSALRKVIVKALRTQHQQSATPAAAAAAPKQQQDLTTNNNDEDKGEETELKMLRENCAKQDVEMNAYQAENEALRRSVNVHKEVINSLRWTIAGLGGVR